MECARAQTEEHEEIPFFLIKGKNHITREIHEKWGKSETVALNISWLLDLARENPTAMIKLQYPYRRGHGGGPLLIYMASDTGIADIALAIDYRGMPGRLLNMGNLKQYGMGRYNVDR